MLTLSPSVTSEDESAEIETDLALTKAQNLKNEVTVTWINF